MKRIFLLSIFIIQCILSTAQQTVPTNEQWVFFPYAAGERVDKKLKILIIGTHLIRFNDLYAGYTSVGDVSISLDYRDIIEPIEKDERYFPGDYDNINFSTLKVADINGTYSQWNAVTIRENGLTANDNTLSAIEKIRTNLIEQYRREGYKIYQVNFMPLVEGEHSAGYKYYDSKAAVYKPYRFERLNALSPLYIPYYRKGEIKSILSSLNNQSVSGISGLVITSSDEKKEATPNNNSSSTTKTKTDEERIAEMNLKEAMARGHEAEGDRLYKLGTPFYMDALKKYQEAQAMYYTNQVQQKINEINSWVVVAKGINAAGQAVADGIEAVDPKKKTRANYAFINYTGLLGNYTKIANPANQQPMDAWLGISGHRVFLSMEARFGYMRSPVFEYEAQRVDFSGRTPIADKFQAQQDMLGLGISGGINIPFKPIIFYALYGVDMGFVVSKKILSPEFAAKDETSLPNIGNRLTFGTIIKIPKTKLAIGVQYVVHSINGEEDAANPITYNKDRSRTYTLFRTTTEKYQYSNWGISFKWTSD